MNSNNATIAKNTLFLYFRMMLTMIISLYTSRVILQVLGIDDYGVYKAVGGVVGFLSFVNHALSTGSSRFLTYGLGEGNQNKLKVIFSTTLTSHVILAFIIILIAETAGLWFFHNKLVLPPDRVEAAHFVFQFSILTAFFTLTQVPYNACIIAHERMKVFAYISIIDAVMKLLIVYLLTIGPFDKLKLYALLLCMLQISVIVFYRLYCGRNFPEARFRFVFDRHIFKDIASFSGWSLFANTSIALNNQGTLVMLNMFFSPAVVTARSISLQVNMAAHQFVSSFQTAANPQIVKKYAAHDYSGSKQLLLKTTRFSFFLMLLLSFPICLSAEHLLQLWLGVVPDYTVVFLQIVIIQSLFQVFDTSLYRALYAKGQLRENALISPLIGTLQFPIVYYLFKEGFSPIVLSWASLVTYAILGMIVKPILVIKIVGYSLKDIISVFYPCIKVSIVSLIFPLFIFCKQDIITSSVVLRFILIASSAVLSVFVTIWTIGITSKEKEMIKAFLKRKITI